MSCECYQIGGRFIAEDPDCPVHGREAQRDADRRYAIIEQLSQAFRAGAADKIEEAAFSALEYLRSL